MNLSIPAATRKSQLRGYDIAIFTAVALSFTASVLLWFTGDQEAGLYVGIWVPSILSLGNYFKLTTRA